MTIVVGGGFYGAMLAAQLAQRGESVTLIEKEARLMTRASAINQARVHQGYHYPRAILTARRSRENYTAFLDDFKDAIIDQVDAYYAIARLNSKVTARQFRLFCERIGAPLSPVPKTVRDFFQPEWVEDVFRVREALFDVDRMREQMETRLKQAKVRIRTGAAVRQVTRLNAGWRVELADGSHAEADQVYLCVYSGLNRLLTASDLPLIALKQELTEMALVELPDIFKNIAVTVMCGPFFSLLPSPTHPGLHTFSHVRYTPHAEWAEDANRLAPSARQTQLGTHFPFMLRDAVRYMPILKRARHQGSLWETKAILPASEVDDSRPILFRRDHGAPGLTCILGGKIDNVYDMLQEVTDAPL